MTRILSPAPETRTTETCCWSTLRFCCRVRVEEEDDDEEEEDDDDLRAGLICKSREIRELHAGGCYDRSGPRTGWRLLSSNPAQRESHAAT